MRRGLKIAGRAVAALAVAYVLLSAGLYLVMLRTPGQIASIFNHVPWPAWVALPMRPMWLHARGGALEVGDQAPDFDLRTWDGKSRINLAAERGKPVVLVFGSYT
jgi:hypothetical protein